MGDPAGAPKTRMPRGVCVPSKAVPGSQVGMRTMVYMFYLEGNMAPSRQCAETQLAAVQIFTGRRLETGLCSVVWTGLELLEQLLQPPMGLGLQV